MAAMPTAAPVSQWFRPYHPLWWALSQHGARRADIRQRAKDPGSGRPPGSLW